VEWDVPQSINSVLGVQAKGTDIIVSKDSAKHCPVQFKYKTFFGNVNVTDGNEQWVNERIRIISGYSVLVLEKGSQLQLIFYRP
jgi:hypothetical protein